MIYTRASREMDAIHAAVIEKIGMDNMTRFIELSAELAQCYEEALV